MLMRALSVVIALGVITGGVSLWHVTAARRVRWTVAALTVYGALAFVHAALTGIGLAGALAGHGLSWFRHGSRLQNAYQAVALTTSVSIVLASMSFSRDHGREPNLDLSRRRAAAVKSSLVTRFAVNAERFTTTGYGKSRPVDTNDTEEGRAHNRRVELVHR